MFRNIAQFEIQIENKICRFTCDNDTPIVYLKEALFQISKAIAAIEDQSKQQQPKDDSNEDNQKEN